MGERESTATRGHCTSRGNVDYDDFALSHPECTAVGGVSESEPEIMFMFRPRYIGSPLRSRG